MKKFLVKRLKFTKTTGRALKVEAKIMSKMLIIQIETKLYYY